MTTCTICGVEYEPKWKGKPRVTCGATTCQQEHERRRARERERAKRRDHGDEINRRARERWATDPEYRDRKGRNSQASLKRRMQDPEYAAAQREKQNAYHRAYNARRMADPEHRERVNAWRRDWESNLDPDSGYLQRKRARERARKRLRRLHDRTAVAEWVLENRGLDPYVCGVVDGQGCGRRLEVQSAEVDHIVPIAQGGAATLENYQLMHKACNSRKRDRMADGAQIELGQTRGDAL